MRNLVFFLEELSAKALLEGLVPRLIPPNEFVVRFVPFEGKQDLHKQLVGKMRNWRAPDTHFVVLRDQDAADCHDVKQALVRLCEEAGRSNTVVRVACREIESWYLGDLAAVEGALGVRGLQVWARSPKHRNVDAVQNPADELDRLTGGAYRKVSGSRLIGPLLDLGGRNRSNSFGAFIGAITALVEEAH